MKTEETDLQFLERMDSQLDLKGTIRALAKALNDENRAKLLAMPLEDQLWLALQAHDDGLVTYGKVVSR